MEIVDKHRKVNTQRGSAMWDGALLDVSRQVFVPHQVNQSDHTSREASPATPRISNCGCQKVAERKEIRPGE